MTSTPKSLRKLNCWEFKDCGRQKGGLMAEILGECPVSTALKFDGLNDGIGAGRVCWMIPNSVCKLESRRASHGHPCHRCEFYLRVAFEEEEQLSPSETKETV